MLDVPFNMTTPPKDANAVSNITALLIFSENWCISIRSRSNQIYARPSHVYILHDW